MSSGEFAARTRLSRKALRLYHELGLLRPTAVDPRTGYRSYAPEQVQRAQLIGLLRRLDLPLDQVAVLLDLDPAAAAKELGEHWRSVEGTHAEHRQLVRYLQDILTGRDTPMFEIQTRDVPEQKVLCIQRHVTAGPLPAFIGEAYQRLWAHLDASAAQAGDPGLVIYHGRVDEDSDGPVEVCLPATGPVEPAADVGVRLEPARTEAYTRITKAQVRFPEILQAYDAVSAWLDQQGRKAVLSPREVYFTDLSAVGADDPAVDIAFPYELHR
jgi:DNA-binding transcriptional MerR regulator